MTLAIYILPYLFFFFFFLDHSFHLENPSVLLFDNPAQEKYPFNLFLSHPDYLIYSKIPSPLHHVLPGSIFQLLIPESCYLLALLNPVLPSSCLIMAHVENDTICTASTLRSIDKDFLLLGAAGPEAIVSH